MWKDDLPQEADCSLPAVVTYLDVLDWTIGRFRAELGLKGAQIDKAFEGRRPFPKLVIKTLRSEIRKKRLAGTTRLYDRFGDAKG